MEKKDKRQEFTVILLYAARGISKSVTRCSLEFENKDTSTINNGNIYLLNQNVVFIMISNIMAKLTIVKDKQKTSREHT